ncbi:uncharacterized protein LOC119675975 [Teleopsis dalmanni]|uniref:uncharacterized protein LOC119675975 n=1 Tax=Teleopsis dalmanni TaxID=139649 RepID=UPI0018CDB026|nr:uncharacterized protein LOC119675975 [Teleopsis dalmanni]
MSDGENAATTPKPLAVTSLKQQRASCKGSLTRINNQIDSTKQLSYIELECRLGLVKSYYKQSTYYQFQIENLDPADGGRNDLDELYITVKTKIKSLMEERRPRDVVNNEHSFVMSPTINNTRLPALKLPHFDGNYMDYKNFIHSFNNLVNNDATISKIEKFNHLLTCLSGEALSTVKAFQVSEENYELVIARLNDRYDNDTLIFLENISALFKVPVACKSDSKQLRNIVDTMSALYSSLKTLSSTTQIMDAIMIHLLMNKVDPGTKQRWEDQLSYETLPTWEGCCKMLERRCQQLEAQGKNNNLQVSNQLANKPVIKGSKQYTMLTSINKFQKSELVCVFCLKKNHSITTCQRFIMLSTKDKKEKVRQLQLCYNCLNKGHSVSECPSRYSCRFCKQRHHSLIHQTVESPVQVPFLHSADNGEHQISTFSATSHATSVRSDSIQKKSTVILATAIILVQDAGGCYHICRALLDSCSQVNLLTHSFAQMLNLRKSKSSIDLSGVDDACIKLNFKTQTTIRSRVSNFEKSVEFLLTNNITGYQPDESISLKNMPMPKAIEFADPEFNVPGKIDALLGTEVFFALLLSGRTQLGVNLPTLQETKLGWIVSGKCESSSMSSSDYRSFCTTFQTSNSNVERLWKLEDVTTQPSKFTIEQQQCEKHFVENVQVNAENRIIVRFPFKTNPDALGNSSDIALQKFYWMERKLNKNPSLKKDYALFLKEYENLGHMSRIMSPDLSRAHYFIPHHYVLKPTSETTKLRVVFDASCRSASQVSLNDLLMVGPTIQNDLFVTLIRFRNHQYGLMADINKMYRQVLLHPDDRRFQLILWRENEHKPISTYMLNTVTYGTSAAPHLAIRSLQYAAENYHQAHELGKAGILNDFYVDDMVTGADDLATLVQIKEEVSEILNHFGMELCKWHCSHCNLNATLERDLQLNEDTTSALGVKWRPDTDVFMFSFKPKKLVSVTTKRSILSFTASFFDPLGLINPIIVVPRIILQQLWVQNISWDEGIPEILASKFKDFIDDLQHLPLLHIPRFVRMSNTIEVQVHGFCDASEKAHGCCLYLRCKDSLGTICVNLLTSKSRLAPTKTCSLPRLELCSAQLLTKLWAKVQPHLSFEISEVHFWSDSQITLHWIRSESSTLSVFVGNRVADIQNLSTNTTWHHVDSANNPADVISLELQTTHLNLERKKTCLIIKQRKPSYIIEQIYYYGNYLKCVRTFAYVLRVIQPRSRNTDVLKASELKNALYHIVWAIQQHHFAREITLLKTKKPIKGQLANLCPFLEQFGNLLLLRVGGRLMNADVSFEVKHPLLLPKADTFVVSLATHIHRSNFHAGPRALTTLIQQEFWVINCKSLATQVVQRVTECLPFHVTGVDFAGPIPTYLKIRGKRPYKSYIAVFVCFGSKAVHLEAVTELSADAFISALKRFVGRRGVPMKIFCDNATNFVGADNKLREFRNFFNKQCTINTITSHCANLRIDFSFIPPRAPHFGGLWEAAVKIAKSHLYKTLSNARLTFEELATALVEIEAVMNSRPLTSISTDPNDLSVLTPGELLIGKKLKHIPEPVITSQEISLLARWKRITAVKSQFWRRWQHEYLCTLQSRNRWQHSTRNLRVGDLVIIHDDNLPPMKWLLGRIIRTVTGADGKVRVAEVKTPETTLTRPIAKLALLPILNSDDSMGPGC